jgi:hypothetical protein
MSVTRFEGIGCPEAGENEMIGLISSPHKTTTSKEGHRFHRRCWIIGVMGAKPPRNPDLEVLYSNSHYFLIQTQKGVILFEIG